MSYKDIKIPAEVYKELEELKQELEKKLAEVLRKKKVTLTWYQFFKLLADDRRIYNEILDIKKEIQQIRRELKRLLKSLNKEIKI